MSRSKRVVVTGGSGRIGSAVVRALAARGHQVVNVDRRPGVDPPVGVRFVYADLRQRFQYQQAFEGADLITHLGEIPHPIGSIPRDELFATNTLIGSGVLQAAADLRIPRVIYTSTCQVYGHWGPDFLRHAPTRFPMDESEPLKPTNQYSLSKVANESYAAFVAHESGTAVTIFRPPWVLATEDLISWRPKFWTRDDRPREGFASYVHVDDLARAYVLATESETLPAGCDAYHFTANDVVSGLPTRERMKQYPETYPKPPTDWPDYQSLVSCEKARRDLGWEPTFSIRSYFRATFGHDFGEPVPDAAKA